MKKPNKNLRQKNYALLVLLLGLVVILFSLAIIKVDVSAAVNMQ